MHKHAPHLVAEWSPRNGSSIESFSPGSHAKVWWVCPKDATHEWEAVVKSRTAGRGCPYCAGRIPHPSTSLAKHYPVIAAEWSSQNDKAPYEVTPNSHYKAWWVCGKNVAHTWRAEVSNRINNGTGCPMCSGRAPDPENNLLVKYPELAAQVSPANKKRPQEYTPQSNEEVLWRCGQGHEWTVSPNARVSSGTGCPYCSGKKPTPENNFLVEFPDLALQWSKKNPDLPESFTAHSGKKVWWECPKGHEWEAVVNSRTHAGGGSGCPYCLGRLPTSDRNLKTDHPSLATEWSPKNDRSPTEVTYGSEYRATWICEKGHEWETTVSNRTHLKTGCPSCAWTHTKLEKSFEALMGVEKWGKNPPDTDLRYLPDFRLTDKVYVDTDGLYWHSEAKQPDPLPRTYHRDKADAFRHAGLRLLQFYEDEVGDKPQIVKSICDAVTGKSANRVGARECEVAEIGNLDARVFYNNNHLLGAPVMCRHVALLHDGIIVGAAAFKAHPAYVDLTRVCFLRGWSVPGGLTRLVKAIQTLVPDTELRTQIDHRYAGTASWVSGGWRVLRAYMNYQYTDGCTRKDKRAFRVKAGVKEIGFAADQGWHRIWDAGKTTLVLQASG